MIELILGGARSGKSRHAEQRVLQTGKHPVYIATATAGDEEMRQRIARHRQQRGADWHTIEQPLFLAEALQQADQADACILVDCLTLWLSNCLLAEDPALWSQQQAALLACLPALKADVILVGNEVGQGIVPLGEINRRFVDENGRLHQRLAQIAGRVTLVVAGLPLTVKPQQGNPA